MNCENIQSLKMRGAKCIVADLSFFDTKEKQKNLDSLKKIYRNDYCDNNYIVLLTDR